MTSERKENDTKNKIGPISERIQESSFYSRQKITETMNSKLAIIIKKVVRLLLFYH